MSESDWNKENLMKLFAALKSSIPKRHTKSVYTRGLKHVDWNEVAFPPFSPEACQKKWTELLHEMRKTRTLTELIDEAEETLSSPVASSRIHPEFPKKPAPPNAIFYEENWAKYQRKHPELSHQKLFQFVAKKYKALPDEVKARYVEKHKLASKEYSRRKLEVQPPKRKRMKVSSDQSDQHSIDAKGLPPKPPSNGYQLFCKEQLSSMAGVSCSSYVSVWAQRWRALTEHQRGDYSLRCNELKGKYATELCKYLNTFSEKQQQQILTENGLRRPKVHKHHVKTFPGEPKMPSRSSNVIFCKKQMQLLREEFPNASERLIKVNVMWRDLSIKEKQRYKQQLDKQFRKYSVELQKWFKTLTAAQQKDYRIQNHSKCQYLDANQTKKTCEREDAYVTYRPSDSEDEAINISSSEEEEDSLDGNKEEVEEEEEEEEGDIAFELY